MQPKIKCRKCDGSGRVPLPEELVETLRIVKKHKRVSASRVHQILDPKAERATKNSQNNRLEDLRLAGLVTREREGKTFYYSPA